jgi:hypothetical protein
LRRGPAGQPRRRDRSRTTEPALSMGGDGALLHRPLARSRSPRPVPYGMRGWSHSGGGSARRCDASESWIPRDSRRHLPDLRLRPSGQLGTDLFRMRSGEAREERGMRRWLIRIGVGTAAHAVFVCALAALRPNSSLDSFGVPFLIATLFAPVIVFLNVARPNHLPWAVMLLLLTANSLTYGVGFAAILRFLENRRPRTPGLCPACGYDLRGSSGACPECGGERPTH